MRTNVALDDDLVREAARLTGIKTKKELICRRRGITVRSSVDCLMAQVVLDVGGTLLHDDDDFDRIAQVRTYRTLRG